MAETLGSLVDKLSIINIKLWFTQDVVHKAGEAREGVPADVVMRLHQLNLQRNALMSEIDNTLAEAVQSGEVQVDPRYKIY